MTEVVAALIWNQNKFMICQHPAHKARGLLWEFAGGKAEPGETKEQALMAYDGVHFTEQGHKAFAAGLLEVLK